MVRVLFVCMGNICRSPMAEAIFQHMVRQAGLEGQFVIDSAGTDGWHAGSLAHQGTRDVLRRKGISYDGCARQVTREDLETFDYIVAMDADNLAGLRRLDPRGLHGNKISRLLDFAPHGSPRDVPDPYYDGKFDRVYALVEAGCRGLFAKIRVERQLAA